MHIKKLSFLLFIISLSTVAEFFDAVTPSIRLKPIVSNVGIIHSKERLGAAGALLFDVGYDIKVGLSTVMGASSFSNTLFSQAAKDDTGFKLEIDSLVRIMPRLSKHTFLGGSVFIGYERQFGGTKSFYQTVSFGDLNFKLGPTFAYEVMPGFYLSSSFYTAIHSMRFGKLSDEVKEKSNLMSAQLEMASLLDFTDDISFFVSIAPIMKDVRQTKVSMLSSFGVNLTIY